MDWLGWGLCGNFFGCGTDIFFYGDLYGVVYVSAMGYGRIYDMVYGMRWVVASATIWFVERAGLWPQMLYGLWGAPVRWPQILFLTLLTLFWLFWQKTHLKKLHRRKSFQKGLNCQKEKSFYSKLSSHHVCWNRNFTIEVIAF